MSESYGFPSPALGPWADRLQPASWRGLPFAIRRTSYPRARRIAMHEYPYRDDPWPEDLGRATRTINITGFLVGDDVFDQRDAFAAACEQGGIGELVHPSLGAIQATLMSDSLGEPEAGRRVELELVFVQTGANGPTFPAATAATQDAAATAADTCDVSCAADFVSDVIAPLAFGEAVVQGAVATTIGFVAQVVGTVQAVEMAAAQLIELPGELIGSALGAVGQVVGLVNDAAVFAGSVLGLAGYFGRYGSVGLTVSLPIGATVASQLAAGVGLSASCTAAAAAALASASSAPLTTLPRAVQTAVAALAAALPAPADQLRLLATLAAYEVTPPASLAPIGAAIATTQTAIAALVRRAALAALARAEAAYQPTSYDDAVTVRRNLTTLLDAEIVAASAAGDNGSFLALRSLRAAIVLDLVTRGSKLPRLTTVVRSAPLPSLLLAQQLYGDATRSDDLIARVDPPHPGFFPTEFRALSF